MKTLWTMAHPQKMIPIPINTLVTMAGVEWNWINVYRMMPVEQKNQVSEINGYTYKDNCYLVIINNTVYLNVAWFSTRVLSLIHVNLCMVHVTMKKMEMREGET
jgi:hypothetical protein